MLPRTSPASQSVLFSGGRLAPGEWGIRGAWASAGEADEDDDDDELCRRRTYVFGGH